MPVNQTYQGGKSKSFSYLYGEYISPMDPTGLEAHLPPEKQRLHCPLFGRLIRFDRHWGSVMIRPDGAGLRQASLGRGRQDEQAKNERPYTRDTK